MFDQPLAFIDVETTGGSYHRDRVIEIGILRVENGQVAGQLNQLINPGTHLPPMITSLTGITPEDLEPAPTFHQIHHQIQTLLDGALFIAHNAPFDYGFIKSEFKREELSFVSRTLCTAKLSRRLFPRFHHHNLDSLITRHGFEVKNRHRAFDDAAVLWDFIKLIQEKFPESKLTSTLKPLLHHPSLPTHIPQNAIDSLPESPGVYLFYGKDGVPLYVGKSVNIKNRVRSHLSAVSNSTKERNLAAQTHHLEGIETAGNLGAELLESRLIKTLQPIFNRTLRQTSTLVSLTRTTESGYDTLKLRQSTPPLPNKIPNLIGVFRSIKQAKDVLATLVEAHSLCLKLVGLETGKGPCFHYHLNKCPGTCLAKEPPLQHNLRLAQAISTIRLKSWPFAGNIVITETGVSHTEYHHFYNWCYLGSQSSSSQSSISPIPNPAFDLDTYRILNRFLNKSGVDKHITHLKKLPIESQNDFMVS
jgi:DNA polymerase III subunit epsilon